MLDTRVRIEPQRPLERVKTWWSRHQGRVGGPGWRRLQVPVVSDVGRGLAGVDAIRRDRFGGVVDRFNFYAPYAMDPERWAEVLAGFR